MDVLNQLFEQLGKPSKTGDPVTSVDTATNLKPSDNTSREQQKVNHERNKVNLGKDKMDKGEAFTFRKHGTLPIDHYGIIGNMRTLALCSTDGSIDYLCYPKFDSPSVFCRLLDKEKGGYFMIAPTSSTTRKQQYLPHCNILATRFLNDDGVGEIIDYMHVPPKSHQTKAKPLLPWIIRVVRVVRGSVNFRMECRPAFNYARDEHVTSIDDRIGPHGSTAEVVESKLFKDDDSVYYSAKYRVVFQSDTLAMDLRHVVKCGEHVCPMLTMNIDEPDEHFHLKSPGVWSEFELHETQQVTFILREVPWSEEGSEKEPIPQKQASLIDPILTAPLMAALFDQTFHFWLEWANQCTYHGRWSERVIRSALTLKLLTYEPTGAVISAPTFGLPEAPGKADNLDYRYVWIRDASWTVYAFIRLGFRHEAERYMHFMADRFHDLNTDGSLNTIYTIDGGKKMEEVELPHLEGYLKSRPVRIGNCANQHLEMGIYGDLMDGIYLYNKYVSPVSYNIWCNVRKLISYVVANWRRKGLSLWGTQGGNQTHTYSLVMCWVAVDRAIRLSEKRVFPCPDRKIWYSTRDAIYEVVQTQCFNPKSGAFAQSIESLDSIDSAALIMPLVLFISPVDPRMLSTIRLIMRQGDQGGLLSNDFVLRYHSLKDSLPVWPQNAFWTCTFWLVESLARAGHYDKTLLSRAQMIFEKTMTYTNHLGLYSEAVARSGEMLGNFPQAFTHVGFISAAFNLDRVLKDRRSG